jgi:hypothetical protein
MVEIKLEKHEWCSTNKLRSAQKWESQKLKERYDWEYVPVIRKLKIATFKKRVAIRVLYNSRLDPDNVSGKFFIDALVKCKVITNDDKRYVSEWSVKHDKNLKHNTYIVILTEEE